MGKVKRFSTIIIQSPKYKYSIKLAFHNFLI